MGREKSEVSVVEMVSCSERLCCGAQKNGRLFIHKRHRNRESQSIHVVASLNLIKVPLKPMITNGDVLYISETEMAEDGEKR
jgi:hypothetical protein